MDSEEHQLEKAPQDVSPITDPDPTLLSRAEVRKGSFLGHERIRVVLPSQRAFKRVSIGLLEATERSQAPRGNMARVIYNVKRLLIGAPLATAQANEERLSKPKGFAILATNPISSIIYATEAILLVLIVAGSSNLWLLLPISLAIVALLSIVTVSYRQILPAYPNGGGSYTVVRDNLGTLPGLVAAAALLIDYMLTASVSIAIAVQNLASLFRVLTPYVVPFDVGLIILITVFNIRGVR